jgi:hypothetical protein
LEVLNLEFSDDELQFVVEDGIVRTHFKLMKSGDRARLEQWITENDWVESFKRANMAAKNPHLALTYRQILEKNAYLRGNHVNAGVYSRSSLSDEDDSEWATPPPGARPSTMRPRTRP